jgi:hypothetical protein
VSEGAPAFAVLAQLGVFVARQRVQEMRPEHAQLKLNCPDKVSTDGLLARIAWGIRRLAALVNKVRRHERHEISPADFTATALAPNTSRRATSNLQHRRQGAGEDVVKGGCVRCLLVRQSRRSIGENGRQHGINPAAGGIGSEQLPESSFGFLAA